MAHLTAIILKYGYMALFSLLALGVAGLPVPDEVLLFFFGSLVAQGHYQFPVALAVSYFGSMTGMLFSYSIGRWMGKPLLERYGKWMRLTPPRIARSEQWFEKYGTWGIIFGYFVPGLRQILSYLAGTARLHVGRYLLFSSIGSLIWCVTFLAVGHALGMRWEEGVRRMEHFSHKLGIVILTAMVLSVFATWFWKKRRNSTD
ncbi:DedA family protein [Paenibacillus terreus]|uniref:DedA family protein n=1 Tax=Paenibacillus terreus TaxID=1387834 RepID=A0ABV5B776_9BACL